MDALHNYIATHPAQSFFIATAVIYLIVIASILTGIIIEKRKNKRST